MGKLYLVRHGESIGNVWEGAYQDDSCNFLSPYGVKQAQLCGEYFKRRGITFKRIISSNKTRARHTTSIILQEMDDWQRAWDVDPDFDELLSSTHQVEECLEAFRIVLTYWDRSENLLIVSHYFVMQRLLEELGVDMKPLYGQGKVIYNAVPYVWNPAEPDKIEMIDLFSPRYNIHQKE